MMSFDDLLNDLLPLPAAPVESVQSFDSLLDELLPLSSAPVAEPAPRPRKSRGELAGANASQIFLMGAKAGRWLEWRNRLIQFCLRKNLVGRKLDHSQRVSEADDMVSAFLAWVCKEDKLKDHLPDIKYNWVQAVMFVQWVQRQREAQGQDALMRSQYRHCRTQQERKVGEYTISSAETATEVVKIDEESGEEVRDLYSPQQSAPDEECVVESVEALISEVFARKARSDKEEELWGRTWEVMRKQNTHERQYESDEAWASDWGMEVRALREVRYAVQRVLRADRNIREAFGR